MDFFKIIDGREPRTGRQFVLKRLDILLRAFSQRLNSSIVKVLHESNDLMTRSCPLRKKAKTDTLHLAADEKPSRYFLGHGQVNLIPKRCSDKQGPLGTHASGVPITR